MSALSKCEAFTHTEPHSAMKVLPRVVMRAKMRVAEVGVFSNSEQLRFSAVSKSDGYPSDGSDEDNTFARWTPFGELSLGITNPDLLGKFKVGDTFYLDFMPAKGVAA